MKSSNKTTGGYGENLAVDLLKSKNYDILEQNYRYGKGEIDIIARDPQTNELVFVEVKTRYNLEYGHPINSITRRKITQIKKIADLYLFENDIKEADCRFDVITVLKLDDSEPQTEHWQNAFNY